MLVIVLIIVLILFAATITVMLYTRESGTDELLTDNVDSLFDDKKGNM